MKWQTKHTTLLIIASGFTLLWWFSGNLLFILPVPLCLSGFIIPSWASLVHEKWIQFAQMLGWINSRILLIMLFFLVLTPIAFLKKLFSKNTDNQNLKSAFISRNHLFKKNDLQNPW